MFNQGNQKKSGVDVAYLPRHWIRLSELHRYPSIFQVECSTKWAKSLSAFKIQRRLMSIFKSEYRRSTIELRSHKCFGGNGGTWTPQLRQIGIDNLRWIRPMFLTSWNKLSLIVSLPKKCVCQIPPSRVKCFRGSRIRTCKKPGFNFSLNFSLSKLSQTAHLEDYPKMRFQSTVKAFQTK